MALPLLLHVVIIALLMCDLQLFAQPSSAALMVVAAADDTKLKMAIQRSNSEQGEDSKTAKRSKRMSTNHQSPFPFRTLLLWYGPVLSEGGFGTEAVEFTAGLDALTHLPLSITNKKKKKKNDKSKEEDEEEGGMKQQREEGQGHHIHFAAIHHGETNHHHEKNTSPLQTNTSTHSISTSSSFPSPYPSEGSASADPAGWDHRQMIFHRRVLVNDTIMMEGIHQYDMIVIVCHSDPIAMALPIAYHHSELAKCPPELFPVLVVPALHIEEERTENKTKTIEDSEKRVIIAQPDSDKKGVNQEIAHEQKEKGDDGRSQQRQLPPVMHIARVMFETDQLPEAWYERLKGFDEIWVPSTFQQRAFSGEFVRHRKKRNGRDNDEQQQRQFLSKEKMLMVPESIDTKIWNPLKFRNDFFDPSSPFSAILPAAAGYSPPYQPRGRKSQKISSSSSSSSACQFKFLSVFKWEDRKGWDVLLHAFLNEFRRAGKRESVCLILKTSVSKEEVFKRFSEQAGGGTLLNKKKREVDSEDLGIYVINGHIAMANYPRLYKSVHCLVQPSRGEGWGRPNMEAMSMQLPVIATNWSGNTEYMKHEENNFLIRVKAMRLIRGNGPFAGHQWAEPDLEHLQELMRYVVTHQNSRELTQLRRQAREDIVGRYDNGIVARQVVSRVKMLVHERRHMKPHQWRQKEEAEGEERRRKGGSLSERDIVGSGDTLQGEL